MTFILWQNVPATTTTTHSKTRNKITNQSLCVSISQAISLSDSLSLQFGTSVQNTFSQCADVSTGTYSIATQNHRRLFWVCFIQPIEIFPRQTVLQLVFLCFLPHIFSLN